MTEARQKQQEPVRARVLEAMANAFRAMKVEDGYYYDYTKAELAEDEAIEQFTGFQWGNSVMLFDGEEVMEAHLRTDLDEMFLAVEIQALVRDESGAERYKVIARVMSDIVKALYVFRDENNGTLIGPVEITSKDWYDMGNEVYGITCAVRVLIQAVDGDYLTVN